MPYGYRIRYNYWPRDCIREMLPVVIHVEDTPVAGTAVVCTLRLEYVAD